MSLEVSDQRGARWVKLLQRLEMDLTYNREERPGGAPPPSTATPDAQRSLSSMSLTLGALIKSRCSQICLNMRPTRPGTAISG